MSNLSDFNGYNPTWCPGCGNWGIGVALKQALVQMKLSPSDIGVVFGIGCSGNMNDFLNAYAVHSLHGRAIPTAVGIKIANHKMPVIVVAGDGDCYGEGGNHFLHACRGNHDIKVIIHDNCVYGLTTGQVAPTANRGYKSKSTPSGIIEVPVNPLAFAITSGATFVAQSFAGDAPMTIDLIKQAMNHKGFALVNILQPCVTFNKVNTYKYYLQHSYKIEKDYDPHDINKAILKSFDLNQEKFPLGVLYKTERSTYTDELPQLATKALVEGKRFTDFDKLMSDFI